MLDAEIPGPDRGDLPIERSGAEAQRQRSERASAGVRQQSSEDCRDEVEGRLGLRIVVPDWRIVESAGGGADRGLPFSGGVPGKVDARAEIGVARRDDAAAERGVLARNEDAIHVVG